MSNQQLRATGSMNDAAQGELTKFMADLEGIATIVQTVAQQNQGQTVELLAILRLLERLHQDIRDNFFQESLPDNRQALYALLRDIEMSGGWPYIHRMKLQALLSNFLPEAETEESSTQE
jgi:ABC-type antimicrobial peptide transport system ATPase subunit